MSIQHDHTQHEFEVVKDWHRPAGSPNEYRIHVCPCGQVWHEGRGLTGLEEEMPDPLVEDR